MDINYSYSQALTLRRFAQSNAFMRGLMGPFGCLPAETEFLTPYGWKRMDAYAEGDLVLQWSPGTGATEFVYPDAYVRKPATEGFVEFDSGSLVMALSPEHRVPHWDWKGAFAVKTARQIAARPSKRTIPTTFCTPKCDWKLDLSDDLIRFAVMMHADGSYPKQGRKAAVCVRKAHKKVRVRQLLAALGIEWTEHSYSERPTELTFRFEPPYRGKHFDAKWWGATEAQLRVVLDEISHWDGLYDHEEVRFFTAEKADADFIQYAAHATGRRAAIHRTDYADPNWRSTYSVNIRVGDLKNKAQVRGDHTRIRRIAGEEQFCFSVPSSFFVVRHRDTIFITGNSGKSSGCVMEIVRRAQAQAPGPDGIRRTRWCVVRNTLPQLKDTTIRTFQQWLPPHLFGDWRVQDQQYIIRAIPGCEIDVLFRAMDRPDQVSNLLSLELTGAWVNEAREVPWGIIEALQGRVGRYPSVREGGVTWDGVFMDTNPPDTDSKWYKFFEEWPETPEGAERLEEYQAQFGRPFMEIFKQPSGLSQAAENLKFLKPGYYETLATGKTREWVKVYVEGQYGIVIDGKPVFPEYDDGAHCSEDVKPVRGEPFYVGLDFGLTPAAVLLQLNSFGQLLVLDEFVTDDMGVERFAEELQAYLGSRWSRARLGWAPEFLFVGDPAGQQRVQTDEKTCFQIFAAKGMEVEPGLQDLTIRLESVRKPLTTVRGKRMGFQMHPRCKALRKALMGGYQLRRLNTSRERYTEKPDKNASSHVSDALEYPCTILFGSALTEAGPRPRGSAEDDAEFAGMLDGGGTGRSDVTGY